MQVATPTSVAQGIEETSAQVVAGETVASVHTSFPSGEEARTPEGDGASDEDQSSDRPNPGLSPRCAEHARVWTTARREAVESYVAYLQEVLRLRDWTITVDWSKPTKKDALATMTQMTDSKHATLHLSPEFIKEPSHLHGQTLVHEMMHCHLFSMEGLTSSTVMALTDKRTAAVFNIAYTAANELATDGLADAFYPLVTPFHLPPR